MNILNNNNLNKEQIDAIQETGNVLVTACPGSGKTRVLTYKIAHELQNLTTTKKIVVGLTFTNRAAEEIQRRVDSMDLDISRLWAGTIHSFCLEWVLKPYAGYCSRIKDGFSIADDHVCEHLKEQIKKELKIKSYAAINTKLDLKGACVNTDPQSRIAAGKYHKYLEEQKLIDFDLIIYLAFKLIREKTQIAHTLSQVFQILCVDEYQDTQELQYAILTDIIKAGKGAARIFFVGDVDQAIYGNLGGVAKTAKQIENEIGGILVKELSISGCYRSTQRIIDYYSNFQVNRTSILGVGKNKNEKGIIYLDNAVNKDQVIKEVARIITLSIKKGIPENEICVVAPQWYMIFPCARKLRELLPAVGFDAPGLSPLNRNPENIWYKIARVCLTQPSPRMYATRLRWANEIIRELEASGHIAIDQKFRSARKLLALINSISSNESEGLAYLEKIFTELISILAISLDDNALLLHSWNSFFEGAKLRQSKNDIPKDIQSLKNMFKESSGVVINTCHGLKGEEFEVVIAFGLLHGYIPHWEDILSGDPQRAVVASKKLMYVVCSRAKKDLYLIAEIGRVTQKGSPYRINQQLAGIKYGYDN